MERKDGRSSRPRSGRGGRLGEAGCCQIHFRRIGGVAPFCNCQRSDPYASIEMLGDSLVNPSGVQEHAAERTQTRELDLAANNVCHHICPSHWAVSAVGQLCAVLDPMRP